MSILYYFLDTNTKFLVKVTHFSYPMCFWWPYWGKCIGI